MKLPPNFYGTFLVRSFFDFGLKILWRLDEKTGDKMKSKTASRCFFHWTPTNPQFLGRPVTRSSPKCKNCRLGGAHMMTHHDALFGAHFGSLFDPSCNKNSQSFSVLWLTFCIKKFSDGLGQGWYWSQNVNQHPMKTYQPFPGGFPMCSTVFRQI